MRHTHCDIVFSLNAHNIVVFLSTVNIVISYSPKYSENILQICTHPLATLG